MWVDAQFRMASVTRSTRHLTLSQCDLHEVVTFVSGRRAVTLRVRETHAFRFVSGL